MTTITIKTKKHKEVLDITEEINKFLEKQEKESGLVFFLLYIQLVL